MATYPAADRGYSIENCLSSRATFGDLLQEGPVELSYIEGSSIGIGGHCEVNHHVDVIGC